MDNVLKLLQIVDLARHWPRLKPIHDLAMDQLIRIAEDGPGPKATPVERIHQTTDDKSISVGERKI